MKLYAESLQSKVEDYEKGKVDIENSEEGSSSAVQVRKMSVIRAYTAKKLAQEVSSLTDKMKEKDREISALQEDFKTRVDKLQALELQVDTIPILKAKIKELDRMVQFHERKKSASTIEQQPSSGMREPRVSGYTVLISLSLYYNGYCENFKESGAHTQRLKSHHFEQKDLSSFERIIRAKLQKSNSGYRAAETDRNERYLPVSHTRA